MQQIQTVSKDQVLAQYQEPTHEGRPLIAGAVVLIVFFFLLPEFVMLQTRGVLLWSFFLIVFLTLYLRKPTSYLYELTQDELKKFTPSPKRFLFSIALRDIDEIRILEKYVRIRIPKKTYLIYTGSTHHSFISRLTDQHHIIKDTKGNS